MFIQFGILNKKYLTVFITPFILAFKTFLSKKDEYNNPFYRVFINFLSLIFCGNIFLISKFLTKSEKKNHKNKSSKIIEQNSFNDNKLEKPKTFKDQIEEEEIEKRNQYKKREKNKNIYIFLLSCLQMIGELIQKLTKNHIIKGFSSNIPVLLELFFFIIFSMIFLNYSLFIHQYSSLFIFFICHIIFFIQTIHYTEDITIKDAFKSFLYIYSFQKSYCLLDIFGKKYLNTFTDNIYLIMFKVGIFGLIPLLLYDIICNVCGFDDKYHGIFKTIFHHFDILKSLRDLSFSVIADIGIWLTINYFSPCHYLIIEIIRNFLNIYLDYAKNKEFFYSNEQIITFSVLYPILIFDLLIFNEIIILNFCGLNKNTRLYIMDREKNDINISSSSLDISFNDINEIDFALFDAE